MKWSSITDRSPALAAIAEFERLGRDAFLAKYGFGKSTRLYVRHEGKIYDIKALASATHGYALPEAGGPPRNNEFSSGQALVELFQRLGFEVVEQSETPVFEKANVLREALQTVLSGYIAAKDTSFGSSTPMWAAIDRAQKALQALLDDYPHIAVRSSVGKGNWAEVPWIALLDKRVTTTTTYGVYAVYLFRADMSGVYATFNQGVTELKKSSGWQAARATLMETAVRLRQRYREQMRPSFTSSDGIDLRSKRGGLGAEYEASTISWRLYESGALPPAKELLDDLYRLLEVYDDYASDPKGTKVTSTMTGVITPTTSEVTASLRSRGYNFEPWQVAAFVHSLRTKPFAILAGISGTGKSKLPLLIGEVTGAHVELIPVRPDWTDSADLLGFTNLQGVFQPGRLLALAQRATADPDRQYVAILDEMNLARVEQYFAEVLSLIEDRKADGTGFASRGPLVPQAPEPWSQLRLPSNVAIVGTVNMDETTHGFSRKVLDRAFTLELSDVDLAAWRSAESGPQASMERWPAIQWTARGLRPGDLQDLTDDERNRVDQTVEVLTEINKILSVAQLQIGYRVRDEIAMFLLHSAEDAEGFTSHGYPVDPLDLALNMKVLPRIQGGTSAIRTVLRQMVTWCADRKVEATEDRTRATVQAWIDAGRPTAVNDALFPRTMARLCLMWERLQADGFTSYWL
jgi:hypothetical protein